MCHHRDSFRLCRYLLCMHRCSELIHGDSFLQAPTTASCGGTTEGGIAAVVRLLPESRTGLASGNYLDELCDLSNVTNSNKITDKFGLHSTSATPVFDIVAQT